MAKKEEITEVIEHGVSYREALVPAYLQWLSGISKYHMDDIKMLFTEIVGIPDAQNDEALIKQGCEALKELTVRSNVPVTLEKYGECPTKEYIIQELDFILEQLFHIKIRRFLRNGTYIFIKKFLDIIN